MTRPASAYDDDFYAWTQEQAAALRAIPAETAGNRIDIAHVAEEIEDLGKRDLREVSSYLARLFEHLMKIASLPDAREVPHWRSEARQVRDAAADAFSPSMRQFIDLSILWARSVKRSGRELAERNAETTGLKDVPFSLDEILSEDFEIDMALGRILAPPSSLP